MAYEKQSWQLGDVITKEKIDHIEDGIYDNSIDKINTNGDSKNMTITGTSSDTNDGQASSWTSVATLTSGETHTSVFAKISQMFKNIRYLYSHKIDIENIVDNLTTDNASKVLSAKQGKILNDNSLISRGTVESGTNLNSVRQIGSYILNGSNSYTNMPTNTLYGVLTVLKGSDSANFITQIITMTTGNSFYYRDTSNGGTSWSSWVELMKITGNTVPSFYSKGVSSNSTTNITLSNNFRGRIDIIGGSSSNCFSIIVSTTSTGVVSYQAIGTHSNITISTSTNTITLVNDSGGANMTAAITAFGGSVTV